MFGLNLIPIHPLSPTTTFLHNFMCSLFFLKKNSSFSASCMYMGMVPSTGPWANIPEENGLFFSQQSTANISSNRTGTSWVSLPPSLMLEFWMAWSRADLVHAVTAAVGLCAYLHCHFWQILFGHRHLFTLALIVSSFPFLQLSLGEEYVIWISHTELSPSQYHTLFI